MAEDLCAVAKNAWFVKDEEVLYKGQDAVVRSILPGGHYIIEVGGRKVKANGNELSAPWTNSLKSSDKVVANALKHAERTATNGIRKDEFTGKQANRKWKVGAKAKDMFGNKGTVTEIFNEDQVGWTNGKSKVQMLFQNDDLTACNSQGGKVSIVKSAGSWWVRTPDGNLHGKSDKVDGAAKWAEANGYKDWKVVHNGSASVVKNSGTVSVASRYISDIGLKKEVEKARNEGLALMLEDATEMRRTQLEYLKGEVAKGGLVCQASVHEKPCEHPTRTQQMDHDKRIALVKSVCGPRVKMVSGSWDSAVRNSDAGNCNSCSHGCKGHKCSLGLSTKVAMNSGRKCQAWRADSLTRAVKRVVVNAKDWVGKTIKVGDKVTPAGSLKGRIFEVLEVYRGDRVKVRMDNGREMNMLSNGLFVTNSVEVKNMSAETAISRIEWMLGSTNRQERDEAAAELEYYRDMIISRAGRAKYDEMMRRACNGESEEV